MNDNNFMRAMKFVSKWEGGFSDDPADPGGKTNFGISDLRDGVADGLVDLDRDGVGDVSIADLTREHALKIYYAEYWAPFRCDKLPLSMAVCIFDTAVNCGVTRTAGMLEGCLTFKDLLAKRINYYSRLVTKRPKLQKFYKGWINRVVDLRKYAEIIEMEDKQ